MKDEAQSKEIERAFGAESRRQMLEEYAATAESVTSANAWKHAYRLLLWIDKTTSLAHCYESDKAQPGRPWYERSLAFHAWVSTALGTTPAGLGGQIDWLFGRGTERLAAIVAEQQAERALIAVDQRTHYKGFPEPGEDPGLEELIREELGGWLSSPPPPDAMRRLTQRIRDYLARENKRKNLVGEGFEDVLGFLIRRLPGASKLKVSERPVLHSLPGFRTPPAGEKQRKVDLAVIGPQDRRILVSAKWSVRADREEQFLVDFEAYARLDEAGHDFSFVLVTNEFDAARLCAACKRRRANGELFTSVVHVNPKGPLAAYASGGGKSARQLVKYIESGRLTSLEAWLASLVS